MTRGELYWVDFGVPVTSNLNLADYKPNVYVTAKESGLSKDSVAIIPLVTALDKMCFIEKISLLPLSIVEEINNAVIEMIH